MCSLTEGLEDQLHFSPRCSDHTVCEEGRLSKYNFLRGTPNTEQEKGISLLTTGIHDRPLVMMMSTMMMVFKVPMYVMRELEYQVRA